MKTGRRPFEHEGHPAAALAILAAIFGVAGVFGILPSRQPDLLPSRELSVWSGAPVLLERAAITLPAPDSPVRPRRRAADAVSTVDSLTMAIVVIDPPLTFSSDAGEPPALVSTPMMPAGPVAAVEAETPLLPEARPQPPPVRAVTAAFDRTGSAILVAFRKTGQGVRGAIGALAP